MSIQIKNGNEDGGKPDQPFQNVVSQTLPNRDNVTAFQISTLLHAAATVFNCLKLLNDTETAEGLPRNMDGGAKCAAEVTAINLCNRLDQIVNDSSRWSFEFQKSAEEAFLNLYKAFTERADAERKSIDQNRSPAVLLRPALTRLEDGRWATILGDFALPESLIIGVGNSPAEAMTDFNRAYHGLVSVAAAAFAEQRMNGLQAEAVIGVDQHPANKKKPRRNKRK